MKYTFLSSVQIWVCFRILFLQNRFIFLKLKKKIPILPIIFFSVYSTNLAEMVRVFFTNFIISINYLLEFYNFVCL